MAALPRTPWIRFLTPTIIINKTANKKKITLITIWSKTSSRPARKKAWWKRKARTRRDRAVLRRTRSFWSWRNCCRCQPLLQRNWTRLVSSGWPRVIWRWEPFFRTVMHLYLYISIISIISRSIPLRIFVRYDRTASTVVSVCIIRLANLPRRITSR